MTRGTNRAGTLLGFLTAAAIVLSAPVAAEQPSSRPAAQASAWSTPTGVISPFVVASWIVERRPAQGEQLRLLVLWRGAAGWFMQPGRVTGGGSSGGRFEETLTYGDVRLTLRYDSSTRVATIQGQAVDVAEDNVVFVDEVDSETGPRVIGTTRIDPVMPGSAAQIGLVLRESASILSFLRCDAPLAGSPLRARLERLCLERIGIIP